MPGATEREKFAMNLPCVGFNKYTCSLACVSSILYQYVAYVACAMYTVPVIVPDPLLTSKDISPPSTIIDEVIPTLVKIVAPRIISTLSVYSDTYLAIGYISLSVH